MESIVIVFISFILSLFNIGQTMPMNTYTHTMETATVTVDGQPYTPDESLVQTSEPMRTVESMTEDELIQLVLILNNEARLAEEKRAEENQIVVEPYPYNDITQSTLAGILLGIFFSVVYIRRHYTMRTFFQMIVRIPVKGVSVLWSIIRRNK